MENDNASGSPAVAVVGCILCGASGPKRVVSFADAAGRIVGAMERCRACGLVHRNPKIQNRQIADIYEEQTRDTATQDWVEGRSRIFSDYMEEMEHVRKRNTVLDVGAGHGFFLGACKSEKWDCFGLEISRVAIRSAKERYGFDLSDKPLEASGFADGSFDVVTLWNVLDHLDDPRRTLEEVGRVLRPGGMLLLRVPNALFHVPLYLFFRRFYALIRRNRVNPATVANYSFSPRSLLLVLRAIGFEKIRIDNSRLVWTTRHDDRDRHGLRRGVAWVVELVSRGVLRLSFGAVHVSPSITVVAVKR